MNQTQIAKLFGTQEKCIAYLEKLRWNGTPVSPFTGGRNVTKRPGTFRYHCNHTNRDFTVLYDTMFEGTRLPLPKWFLLAGLMLDAKKGIASSQIMRNLGVSYKTAWYCQMRVRCAMVSPDTELSGILQMDESFIGGKPRSGFNPGKSNENIAGLSEVYAKRGRGTRKVPFVGIVQPKGRVVTKVIEKLSTKNLLAMLKRYSKMDESAVVTDGYSAYRQFEKYVDHIMVKHSEQKKGYFNTAAIEGFFSIVKKGVKGNYVSVSKKYLPFYLVEFEYKYNLRNEEKDAFEKLMRRAVETDKEMLNYKPVRPVKNIVYPAKPKKSNINT